VTRALAKSAALGPQWPLACLDHLQNGDLLRRKRESVATLPAGLGHGDLGSDELAKDLGSEGPRDRHLSDNLTDLAVLTTVVSTG
jgi:hypothetical protein